MQVYRPGGEVESKQRLATNEITFLFELLFSFYIEKGSRRHLNIYSFHKGVKTNIFSMRKIS
jgi:hypothetical protein